MRRSCCLVLLPAIICAFSYSAINANNWNSADISAYTISKDSLNWADYYYNIGRYDKAISIYQKNLENHDPEKIHAIKRLALSEAALENPSKSINHIIDYLLLDFNPNFLLNEGFDQIRNSTDFKKVSNKVIPKITFWSLLYFFVAVIGFYVVFVITINKQIHRPSRFLIASFIFIHSLFMLNISLNRANYMFEYPHTYLMSTWASFLYGPLLYFYFKQTSQKYRFKVVDILHTIPTLLLLGYLIFTVYSASAEDKIQLMLSRLSNQLNPQDSSKLLILVVLKIISLAIYGYFIKKVYSKSAREKLLDTKKLTWQKNIYQIHILYVITYTTYGFLIINHINNGVIYDTSTIAMAIMVIYVGYSANIQPDVFSGIYSYKNRLFPKYKKSGLTPSLSHELKENLIHLFAVDKIYKENNINLDMVAQKLNTSRHNASQVINEHFNLSFHELINKYRIEEAKKILIDDQHQNLNIIDVAYEVGYNNKVTFNKAFKKYTHLTPSQFQRRIPPLYT